MPWICETPQVTALLKQWAYEGDTPRARRAEDALLSVRGDGERGLLHVRDKLLSEMHEHEARRFAG